jgi:hypothetical protein
VLVRSLNNILIGGSKNIERFLTPFLCRVFPFTGKRSRKRQSENSLALKIKVDIDHCRVVIHANKDSWTSKYAYKSNKGLEDEKLSLGHRTYVGLMEVKMPIMKVQQKLHKNR